ncbi:hypothetical protein A6A03_07710 [Chloroflexus islandicus]|uniref:Uncharacterized protein n=1 Tax=Chloroflexus islandicus TaxID=1707952 RepID=A0A178MIC3_9CHLR|nr:PD40 domain-containing protein [Chloroflexus islandicus]OAN48462.1 hypothetical protein A6A03_07710 [Chloroflexus islandicus]
MPPFRWRWPWRWLLFLLTGCGGLTPLPTTTPPLPPRPPIVSLDRLAGQPLAGPAPLLTPANAAQAVTLATLGGIGRLQAAFWLDDGRIALSTNLGLALVDPATGQTGPLFGPEPPVLAIGALPGQRLLLRSLDSQAPLKELLIWDVAANRATSVPIPLATRLTIAPDGTLFALHTARIEQVGSNSNVSEDGRLVITDAQGREVRTLTDRSAGAIAFSPDGRLLAIGRADFATLPPKLSIALIDLASGATRQTLTGISYQVERLCFVPGTPLLIVQENGGGTSLWDVESGQKLRDLGTLAEIAVAPDGAQAAAIKDAIVRRWSLPEWRELPPLSVPAEVAPGLAGASLAFAPNSAHLMAIGAERLAVWDTTVPGAPPLTLAFTAALQQVTIAPDGATLATAGGQESILWDLASGEASWRIWADQPAFAFTPDGSQILVRVRPAAEPGDRLGLRDMAGDTLRLLSLPANSPAFAVSPTGTSVVMAASQSLFLYDLTTGGPIWAIDTPPTLGGALSGMPSFSDPIFSPDGRFVAMGADAEIRVWDAANGTQLRVFTHKSALSGVNHVAFAPDSVILASLTLDSVIVWDVARGKAIRTLKLDDPERLLRHLAFSPDGALLAVATKRNASVPESHVLLWEMATGQVAATLTGHLGAVTSVAFAPDGTLLATAATDGTVRLWGVRP